MSFVEYRRNPVLLVPPLVMLIVSFGSSLKPLSWLLSLTARSMAAGGVTVPRPLLKLEDRQGA